MKPFDAMLLVGIISLIVIGAIFSEGMFRSLSTEANNGTPTIATNESALTSYGITYSWIYVIAIILILAVIIIAWRLLIDSAL